MAASKIVVASLPLLVVAACAGPATTSAQVNYAETKTYVIDLPVGDAPFDTLAVSWVHRMDQPYVFIDHYGSYTETGTLIPVLLREMTAQGLEPSGPPFCLFYDDPAAFPAAELRSRACVPIRAPRSPLSPLNYEVLASRAVAYAFVSGPYPEVPRAYPKIIEFMAGMNWVVDGPIREIYIVQPSTANGPRELVCHVEIPAGPKSAPNTSEIGGI